MNNHCIFLHGNELSMFFKAFFDLYIIKHADLVTLLYSVSFFRISVSKNLFFQAHIYN